MTIRLVNGILIDADTLDGSTLALLALVTDLTTHADLITGMHGVVVAHKTADETLNNDDTLQNDDHLFFAVAVNEVWEVFVAVMAQSPTLTTLKSLFAIPAAATFMELGTLKWSALDTLTDLTVERAQGGMVATAKKLQFRGLYVGGANAGSIQFQWAQNAATAEDTKVLADSFIIAHRLK
ncbi:unnamed protein product [marine sediment metagenome]|uniref:Uncharacterized protein n=1 Tax=marine sediment metagenome TaxID=412755 RepID=X1SIW5_9ZZZZ